jgi:uncharacterized membrane protein (TIGR01666 family)
MIRRQAQEIQYFLYGQAFADGFRTTLAILLPALIGSFTNHFELGITISTGALCVSLTDAPGPFIHKRNGMLICNAFVFLIALLTSFARLNIYTLGLEIAFVTFFFSMFSVYGARATGIGSAAILIMILTMDRPIQANDAVPHAFLITAGGLFYMIVTLLLNKLRPYIAAQRALSDCIREVAKYLSIKADFYNTKTDLNEDYNKLFAQQIVVSEKQDATREILFKTRQIVNETTTTGRRLVYAFVETVDLFEDITASYYDYSALRERFAATGFLEEVHALLKEMVQELDSIAIAIQQDTSHTPKDFEPRLIALKEKIDALQTGDQSKLVLRKILVNIRKLIQRFNELNAYFIKSEHPKKKSTLDHSQFVGHQALDPKIMWSNFTLSSNAFRHAIRVCVACIVGFIIAKLIAYGHHSYWVLLTVAFILKPAFSLTKQRNVQRIIGTFAGGLIGAAILLFVHDKTALFIFMVLFMLGTYSFMRINYLVMVICTTPFVLILFSFLGVGFVKLFQERIIDTLIGCAVAFTASYFLFPSWEKQQLKYHVEGMLKANAKYLLKVVEALMGRKVSILDYKLARKEVYVSSANLTSAFQRMLSEPKSKQTSQSQLHQFVVLNYILFSNTATAAATVLNKENKTFSEELVNTAKATIHKLNDSIHRFNEQETIELPKTEMPIAAEAVVTKDDVLMKEQLEFIHRLSIDIDKAAKAIAAAS